MVKNMSKKSAPISTRPEPPGVEAIVKDIEAVEYSDVLFSAQVKRYIALDVPGTSEELAGKEGIQSDRNNGGKHRQSSGNIPRHKSEPNVEIMYKQAVRFIDLTEALKNAPGRLQEQCEHLQTAGEGLKNSIDELKDQAQAALNASMQE